jgi:hypothetical protein
MSITINDLAILYPEQLLLEISERDRETAWQQTQNQQYSNNTARWNAYINRLCLNVFFKNLETELTRKEKVAVLPSLETLPSIWEVVGGVAMQIGETRLVLIPSERDSLEEFRVPREWVEIPHWAGDYYLAIEINLENGWLQVWGYSTYQQLREDGRRDRTDETYAIDAFELVEDLNTLWVSREVAAPSKPQVEPLESLTALEANRLIEELQQPTPYLPRLEIPFRRWAALLANNLYRQKLYERRCQSVATLQTSTNLAQWFGSVFQSGWQSLETWSKGEREVAYTYRQQLRTTRQVTAEGIKLIDLGVQLGDRAVALLIGLTQEEDKVSVRVQLYPAKGDTYLPQNIQLALLTPQEKVLQTSQARMQDNLIQLKRFTCPVGTNFKIQVALDRFTITEDFQIQP